MSASDAETDAALDRDENEQRAATEVDPAQSNGVRSPAGRRAQALANPARVYRRPMDVLGDPALDRGTRRRVLEGWALDERRLMVSTDENMGGGRTNRLAAVVSALQALEGAAGAEAR